MEGRPTGYIPAFGYDWLLPVYDPLLRWVVREETFKRRLIQDAQIQDDHQVLNLGCGTGTLTLLVKRLHPGAQVYGLDGDPKALALARRKAEKAGMVLTLDQGLSYTLPYADESFDRVLSSLMFHHSTREDKIQTLSEVWRVLTQGGSLHIVDFGTPSAGLGAHLSKLIHRGDRVHDNIQGQLIPFLKDAGFAGVEECGRHSTIVGSLSFYQGTKRPSA